MQQLIFYIIILGSSYAITNTWAKYGWLGLGMPGAHREPALTGVFIGSIFGAIGSLLNKYGYIHLTLFEDKYFWTSLPIFTINPFVWLLCKRYILMRVGEFDYNRAIIRTKHWTKVYYVPGQALQNESEMLRDFPLAQKTIELFLRAISALEYHWSELVTGEPLEFRSYETLLKAYEELALLYRMMHRFNEAQAILAKALEIAEPLADCNLGNKNLAIARNLIWFSQAETYQVEGIESHKAIELYERCLPLAQELGFNRDVQMMNGFIEKLRKKEEEK